MTTPTFSILDVPPEIVSAIVRQLDPFRDRKTLVALTTTCRLLSMPAIEHLHSEMTDSTLTTQRVFLESLVRYPLDQVSHRGVSSVIVERQRAALVRVYHAFEGLGDSGKPLTSWTYLPFPVIDSDGAPRRPTLDFFQMLNLLEFTLPAILHKMVNLTEFSVDLDPWETSEGYDLLGRPHMRIRDYMDRWNAGQRWIFNIVAGTANKGLVRESPPPFRLESFACRNVRARHYSMLAEVLAAQRWIKRITFLEEDLPARNTLEEINDRRQWLEVEDTASELIFFRGQPKSMTTFLPLAQGRVQMLVWEPSPVVRPLGIQMLLTNAFVVPQTPSFIFFNPIQAYMQGIKFLTISSEDWRIPNLKESLVNLQCLQLHRLSYTEDLEYLTTLHLQTLLIPRHNDIGEAYDVQRDILPKCRNVRYVGEYFSSGFNGSNEIYRIRIWGGAVGAEGRPETYSILKSTLKCHHVFERLPEKYSK